MSILTVPSTMPYPPGYGGNGYSPNDISKFFDLNWPDHAGMLAQGYSAPGLGFCPPNAVCHGLNLPATPGAPGISKNWIAPRGRAFGMGQDDSGDDEIVTSYPEGGSTTTPVTTTPSGIVDSNAACGAGWSIVISNGEPVCQQNSTPLNTPLTPAQAGLTPAQQAALIAATGNSAVSLIRTAAGGPYTVAGTNLVYNPATGQLTTSTAVNATASLTAGLASIGPYVPWIIAAVAAVAILPSLFGGKR